VIKIVGNIAPIAGVGAATITAKIVSLGYYAATDSYRLNVNPSAPTISFAQPSSPISSSKFKPFKLAANSNSGGTVTFKSSDSKVISISGSTATIK